MIQNYVPNHLQLLPDLQMIADELDERNWEFTLVCGSDAPGFRSFQIYVGQPVLKDDILYILDETANGFPVDSRPYIVSGEIHGKAPHICVSGQPKPELINTLMTIFQRYLDFVAEMNRIVSGGGDLDDLCRVGCDFLKNPMYIHDSGFTVLALPCHVFGMMGMDYNPHSDRHYIPLWLVEDFKLSDDYIATLQKREAAIWGTDQYPYNLRTLYVNIWDEDHYRGRLLINELHTCLTKGQFRLAELVADYALQIIRRDEQNVNRHYRDFEDTFKTLIAGKAVDYTDMQMLLSVMGWKESDRYVLSVLQSQDPRPAITGETSVQNQLQATLPNSFSFFYEQRLCTVVNLTRSAMSFPTIRSKFAPILRDSLMYGGSSFPIAGIYELPTAFSQALYALEQAFRYRQSRWFLTFEDCALPYMLSSANQQFATDMIASPALQFLRDHDREKGTEYYRTLRCYLQCERSIPRASAALIIHRTTLEYRLEKIQSLVHLDLEDEALRLYLLLSFKMLDEAQG